MSIIYKSNSKINRRVVIEYIKEKKAENPNFKVIDIGGAANPWCNDYVDAYIDIFQIPGKLTFVGDINSDKIWDTIAQSNWDFCICSHILEDIRCPEFVINRIKKIFKAGFIAMPNKHSELSHIETSKYLGYCHHRWIYTLVDNDLYCVAKMPVVQLFNQEFENSKKNKFITKIFKKQVREDAETIYEQEHKLGWVKHELVGRETELAFIWESDFNFKFINNDFAGQDISELLDLYKNDLSQGL